MSRSYAVGSGIINFNGCGAIWWISFHINLSLSSVLNVAVLLRCFMCRRSRWHWLRSFSNLDRSRSIRAKRSVFFINSRSLRRIWQKSVSATSICAAGRRRSLFTWKRRRGLRRSVQTRTRWPRPLRPERSARSFSPDWIALVWQI